MDRGRVGLKKAMSAIGHKKNLHRQSFSTKTKTLTMQAYRLNDNIKFQFRKYPHYFSKF